jgi:hypothetical protein
LGTGSPGVLPLSFRPIQLGRVRWELVDFALVGSVGVSTGEKAWKNRKDSTKKKLAF